MQSNAHLNTLASNYYVSDSGNFTNLSKVNNEKDLGVWVTNKLDSSLHCQKAVAKANIVLGMIKRTFPSMSKCLSISVYNLCEASSGIRRTILEPLFTQRYRYA